MSFGKKVTCLTKDLTIIMCSSCFKKTMTLVFDKVGNLILCLTVTLYFI